MHGDMTLPSPKPEEIQQHKFITLWQSPTGKGAKTTKHPEATAKAL